MFYNIYISKTLFLFYGYWRGAIIIIVILHLSVLLFYRLHLFKWIEIIDLIDFYTRVNFILKWCTYRIILCKCNMNLIISDPKKQTMNVHLLRHMPQFVRLHGPLFQYSCFGFESMNNHLKNMVHGTRYINDQVRS